MSLHSVNILIIYILNSILKDIDEIYIHMIYLSLSGVFCRTALAKTIFNGGTR